MTSPTTLAPETDTDLAPTESGEPSHLWRKPYIKYTPELAEYICSEFMEGKSLFAISKEDGLPTYNTILMWATKNEEFAKMLAGARVARALHHEALAEKTLEDIDHMDEKDRVGVSNFKFEGHMRLAGINDQSRFGKKTTVEGNPDKPITFVIQTGVPDPLPHQRQPELGMDGLIKKAAENVIEAEIVSEEVVDAGSKQAT